MSAEGRCGTCRFWACNGDGPAIFDEEAYEASAHRKCVAVIHGNTYEEGAGGTPKTPAMVCAGSGYAATFYTLPTFGCTLYEPQREKKR